MPFHSRGLGESRRGWVGPVSGRGAGGPWREAKSIRCGPSAKGVLGREFSGDSSGHQPE